MRPVDRRINPYFYLVNDDAAHMRRALQLAALGWPAVAPNPLVGCVIACNGEEVASGYHQRFGGAHAEVNAIAALPPGISPGDCVLYVTLEPCNHFGKTPPCTGLLIKKGFRKVVVAASDPNPLVAGQGIRTLLEAGIEVKTGVLEEEARSINRRFFTFHEKRRPYVILKWAMSADGYIARAAGPLSGPERQITGEAARVVSHGLRAENMAIMVGKNTVLHDNPSLTTRLVQGNNPVRVFVDTRLEVPRHFQVYNGEAPTIVFNYSREGVEGHIRFVKIAEHADQAEQILAKLHELGIQSLVVEGGTRLLESFIEKGLWDEAMVFQNPLLELGGGVKGPVFPIKNTFELVGDDKLYHYVK
jgi:diaminohydroxyphosphoribosylaminopyrimidine deaminase / 5-amino-6-(5-phosphoribosylamino)uracil reductase